MIRICNWHRGLQSLTILISFYLAGTWLNQYNLIEQLNTKIQPAIMSALEAGLYQPAALGDDSKLKMYLQQQISTDLSALLSIPSGGFQQCSALVQSLDDTVKAPASEDDIAAKPIWLNVSKWSHLLEWQTKTSQNDPLHQLTLQLNCDRAWSGSLLLHSVIFSALVLALMHYLPSPLNHQQRIWFQELCHHGQSVKQAKQLLVPLAKLKLSPPQQALLRYLFQQSGDFKQALLAAQHPAAAHLDDIQQQWLWLALDRKLELEQALTIATQADRLQFDLNRKRLWVHGLEVTLASTPLFYYYLYAQLRASAIADGWLQNPQSNKPDPAMGASLSKLMQTFGGHSKAITELNNKGLRAKTLDQNRSKIKDELISQLGEQLAQNYLFETDKNAAYITSRYRLLLAKEYITI